MTTRYFNVFGPRQDPSSPYSGVISLFIRSLIDGRPPTIYGDGEQTRDFTYVANVVDGVLKACHAPGVSGRVINVATGGRVSLNELFESLRLLTGASVAPTFGPPRAGDIRDSQADIERARTLLGYAPTIAFDEGLARTLAWAREARRGGGVSRRAHVARGNPGRHPLSKRTAACASRCAAPRRIRAPLKQFGGHRRRAARRRQSCVVPTRSPALPAAEAVPDLHRRRRRRPGPRAASRRAPGKERPVRHLFVAAIIAAAAARRGGALQRLRLQEKSQDAKAAPAQVVNLNTAPAEQLERLPGVGPSTAARIIEYRQKNGGFKKIEELMNVRGIGEKAFLKMKSQLTVTAPKADQQ